MFCAEQPHAVQDADGVAVQVILNLRTRDTNRILENFENIK